MLCCGIKADNLTTDISHIINIFRTEQAFIELPY